MLLTEDILNSQYDNDWDSPLEQFVVCKSQSRRLKIKIISKTISSQFSQTSFLPFDITMYSKSFTDSTMKHS